MYFQIHQLRSLLFLHPQRLVVYPFREALAQRQVSLFMYFLKFLHKPLAGMFPLNFSCITQVQALYLFSLSVSQSWAVKLFISAFSLLTEMFLFAGFPLFFSLFPRSNLFFYCFKFVCPSWGRSISLIFPSLAIFYS